MGGGRGGGGRNRQFGNVAISVSATFEDAARAINALEGQFGRLQRAVQGVRLEPQFAEDLRNAREQIDSFIEDVAQLGEVNLLGRNIDDLRQVEGEIRKIEQAFRDLGRTPSRDAVEQLRELRAEARRLTDELGGKKIPGFLPVRGDVLETAREITRLRGELSLLERAFEGAAPIEVQKTMAALRAEIAGLSQTEAATTQSTLAQAQALNKLETQIRALTKPVGDLDDAGEQLRQEVAQLSEQWIAQARALGVSDRAIQQFQHRIEHLSRGVGTLGRGAAATGPFAFLERGIDRASGALNRLGLNFRDVSVIAGAGFLSGGIAFAVRAFFDMASAAGRAAVAVAQLGDRLQTFRERAVNVFGEASEELLGFGRAASQAFGLAEIDALRLAGSVSNLFLSFGTSRENAVGFAVDLAEAAKVIKQTSFTSDSYTQVLEKLQGALTGNIEALREYGIAVNETSLKQTAAAHGIRLMGGEMDAATKAILAQLFIIDQAQERQDAAALATDNLSSAQERLRAEFQNLQAEVGTTLVPLFLSLVEAGNQFLAWINDSIESFREWTGEHEQTVEFLGAIIDHLNTLPETFAFLETLVSIAEGMGEGFEFAADQAERLLGLIPDLPDIPLIPDALKGQRDDAETEVEDQGRSLGEAFGFEFKGGVDRILSGSGALGVLSNLFDFLGDPAGSAAGFDNFVSKVDEMFGRFEEGKLTAEEFFDVLSSLTDLTPAEFQQVFRDNFDALSQLIPGLEQYRDELVGAAFDEAQLEEEARKRQESMLRDPKFLNQLIDAWESYQSAIEDAAEAEEDAVKAVEKARVDAAKRIEDAEERLADAREDAAERELDAREALADAELDRSEAILEAREKLAEVEEDQAERILDAEEKLSESRIQSSKRVSDAERRLHDARIKQADQLLDAQLSVEEAIRRGDAEAFNRAQLELTRAKRSEGVHDAELALQEARVEGIEAIAEAEEDLHEAREEQARAIEDATRDLNRTIEDHNDRVAEARDRLSDAIIDGLERVMEAQERLDEVTEESQERIIEAEERLNDAREKGIENIEKARERVQELEGSFSDTTAQVDELLDRLERLRSVLGSEVFQNTLPVFSGGGGPLDLVLANVLNGLQHGGSAFANHPYVIGEAGPELFIPNQTGQVVSNDQLMRVLSQMSRTRGTNQQNFTVIEAAHGDATAEAIAARLAQEVEA